MPSYIRIPLAIDLLLIVIRQLFPLTQRALPIGGSDCMQLGILLVVGVVAYELISASRDR